MSSSTLLRFPPELRLGIYEYLFRSENVYIHDKSAERCRLKKRNVVETGYTSLSILFVCRFVRQEAQPVFLRQTTFICRDCQCWALERNTKVISSSLQQAFLNIQKLDLNDNIDGAHMLEARLERYLSSRRTALDSIALQVFYEGENIESKCVNCDVMDKSTDCIQGLFTYLIPLVPTLTGTLNLKLRYCHMGHDEETVVVRVISENNRRIARILVTKPIKDTPNEVLRSFTRACDEEGWKLVRADT